MLDLLPNEDQDALISGLAQYMSDALPLARYRTDDVIDDKWRDVARLGCFGISLPEEAGGSGLSIVEEAMAFKEYGRFGLSPAIVTTTLAAHMAYQQGNSSLCAEFLSGESRAVPMVQQKNGTFLIVDTREGFYGLSVTEQTVELYAPDALNDKSIRNGLDETLLFHQVAVSEQPCLSFSDRKLSLSAPLLSAAISCGLLEATRDMATDYAKTREQFGKPIGSFQAVKHKCSDMALWAEAAWSQTAYAALMLQSGADDSEFHVQSARWIAGDAALKAARHNINIHGGMGFTAEIESNFLLKRSHVMNQLFGDPRLLPKHLLSLPHNI